MKEHVSQQLFAYVLETLDIEEYSAIRQHLQICHQCHRLWLEVRDILTEIPYFLQPSQLPPWLADSLQQATNECNRFTVVKRSLVFFTQLTPSVVDHWIDQIDNPTSWQPAHTDFATATYLRLPNKCSLWRWPAGATLPATTVGQHGTVLILQGAMRGLQLNKYVASGDYCNLAQSNTCWRIDHKSPLIYCHKQSSQPRREDGAKIPSSATMPCRTCQSKWSHQNGV